MNPTTKFLVFLLLAGIFIAGCKKDDPISAGDTAALYEDAAEIISTAMGDESGGAAESYGDILNVAGGGSFSVITPTADGDMTVTAGDPIYDPATGWWTVTVDRSRSNNMVSFSFQREYRYQFQKNGVFQQYRISGNDTATTLKFKTVSGTGYFSSPRVKHHLTSLSGAWTVTDIDKDTVTINSDTNYVRAGIDSIITRNMIRTFDHTLTITKMTNVRGPRYRPFFSPTWRRDNCYQAISGTVEGNFSATITFQRGEAYKERSINTSFVVTFGGGNGTISIIGDGRGFGFGMKDGQRP